jgi:hypothetical protein
MHLTYRYLSSPSEGSHLTNLFGLVSKHDQPSLRFSSRCQLSRFFVGDKFVVLLVGGHNPMLSSDD